jgi:hypothetical protein
LRAIPGTAIDAYGMEELAVQVVAVMEILAYGEAFSLFFASKTLGSVWYFHLWKKRWIRCVVTWLFLFLFLFTNTLGSDKVSPCGGHRVEPERVSV